MKSYIANKKQMLGIYCRISQEKELGKDRSIDYQKDVGIQKANELGTDYKIYVDEGISGTWDIDKRPKLNEMIEDITSGIITSVYVLDQSRLERNPQVRYLIQKLFLDNKIRLYTESGEVDLNDVESTLMGDIMSVINNFHVKITKRKVKAVLKKNAREGKGHAILPYGYTTDDDRNIVIDDEESKVVKFIFKRSLEGIGYRKIANELNENNVETRYSKIGKGTYYRIDKHNGNKTIREKSDSKWVGQSVRNIIGNRTYMGERMFGGEIYPVPVIIPKREWEKVQKNLKKNMTSGVKENQYDYLLNGICTCGKCGKAFNGRIIKSKNRIQEYYQCVTKRDGKHSCGNKAIQMKWLENTIETIYFKNKRILNLVNPIDNNKDIIKESIDRIEELRNRLEENKSKKSRVIQAVIDGLLTKEDIRTELDKIEKNNNEIQDMIDVELDKMENNATIIENTMDVELDLDNLDINKLIYKYIKELIITKDKNGIRIVVQMNLPMSTPDIIECDNYYNSLNIL